MSNIDYFKKFMPVIPDLANMNFDVWSYTRVSSKEQFTNNSSVSNQINHNIKYAKGQNYNIVENFGVLMRVLNLTSHERSSNA